MPKPEHPSPTPPLIVRRLLSMTYDLLPCVAVWMLLSAVFTVLHGNRPLAAFSGPQWLLWAACWLATGLYATLSWRRGGQTLGMRPWRLKVTAADGGVPTLRALWLRYAIGCLSLLPAGLGFWWGWFDRAGLTWHDRASATRVVRMPKTPSGQAAS